MFCLLSVNTIAHHQEIDPSKPEVRNQLAPYKITFLFDNHQ